LGKRKKSPREWRHSILEYHASYIYWGNFEENNMKKKKVSYVPSFPTNLTIIDPEIFTTF
jgi:hypothetical protein